MVRVTAMAGSLLNERDRRTDELIGVLSIMIVSGTRHCGSRERRHLTQHGDP